MNTLPTGDEEQAVKEEGQAVKTGLRFEWKIDETGYHGHKLAEFLDIDYIIPEDAEKIIAEMRKLSRTIDDIGKYNTDPKARSALRALSDILVEAHRHVHQFLPAAPISAAWDVLDTKQWVLARILVLMPQKPSWALN